LPTTNMKKFSYGLLVYRTTSGQLEVLIAHMGGPFHAKKDAGHWSIPKGIDDSGTREEPIAIAKREFSEELGLPAPGGELIELGAVDYKSGKKTVQTWAVEADLNVSNIQSNTFEMEWPPKSGKKQSFPEIDRAAYFDLTTAAAKLIPEQAEFLDRLAEKMSLPLGPQADPPDQASLL